MFGKKREKLDKTSAVQVPEISKEDLLQRAAAAEKEWTKQESNYRIQEQNELETEERIHLLNELGSLYFQAGVIDKAIYYYETSLDENKALGKPYTDLMKLYNIKRREAADSKDESGAKEYLEKIEGLMQLSKDVIRGKI